MDIDDIFDEIPRRKEGDFTPPEGAQELEDEFRDRLQEIVKSYKGKYKTITVEYSGAGDNFDSFSYVYGDQNTYFDKNEDLYNFSKDYEDLLFELLNNSDADFNNDGSSGQIIFDIEEGTVRVENSYYVTESYPNDPITFY